MNPRRAAPLDASPSLSAGYLAALPLFLVYEAGLAAMEGSAARSSAERLLTRLLFLFGSHAQLARLGLLLGLALLALVHLARSDAGIGRARLRTLARLVLHGVLAGFLLGPILVGLQGWLGGEPLDVARAPARGLSATLRLVGAAPWEELLFRVGLYGGVFLLVRRTTHFLGLESRAAHLAAELTALLASALLFSLFHLGAVQVLLGSSGEAFHAGLFLWRLSAGILLGALYRWRGLGVAAWAHAVFNLGIALGIRA